MANKLATPQLIELEAKKIIARADMLTLTETERAHVDRALYAVLDQLLPMYGGYEIEGFQRYPGGRSFQVIASFATTEAQAIAIAMAACASGVLSIFARTPIGGYTYTIKDSVCANHYEFRRYLIETKYPGMATNLVIS